MGVLGVERVFFLASKRLVTHDCLLHGFNDALLLEYLVVLGPFLLFPLFVLSLENTTIFSCQWLP